MGYFRAVYTVWQREVLKWIRRRGELIASLIAPFIWLAVFGMGLGRSVAIAPGMDYLSFLAPGVVCQTLLFSSFFNGVSVLYDRNFGFMQEVLVAPVPRVLIVVGKVTGGATIAFLQGCMTLGLAVLLGAKVIVVWLGVSLGVMALVSLAFMAMGVAIASGMRELASFQRLGRITTMPMWFLSGAVFALYVAPPWLVAVSCLNPLTYGVDALRASIAGMQMFPFALDLAILAGFAAAMMLAATILFSRVED